MTCGVEMSKKSNKRFYQVFTLATKARLLKIESTYYQMRNKFELYQPRVTRFDIRLD